MNEERDPCVDQKTKATQLLVDTLSTRALSLCRLPFLWQLPDLLVQRAISTSLGLGLLALALPIPPRTGSERFGVWTSPGVYLVFLSSCFLIGFRCEYPIEALNK